MTNEIPFIAQIDEFEPRPSVEQIRAEVILYNKETLSDRSNIADLSYPKEFIPTDGWFPGAKFRGKLILSSEPSEIDVHTSSDLALHQFEAELNDFLAKDVYIYLQDSRSGENQGLLLLARSLLPDWLESKGDVGYAIIKLEYDHTLLTEGQDQTAEELEKRRKRYHEKFAEWEENEF